MIDKIRAKLNELSVGKVLNCKDKDCGVGIGFYDLIQGLHKYLDELGMTHQDDIAAARDAVIGEARIWRKSGDNCANLADAVDALDALTRPPTARDVQRMVEEWAERHWPSRGPHGGVVVGRVQDLLDALEARLGKDKSCIEKLREGQTWRLREEDSR